MKVAVTTNGRLYKQGDHYYTQFVYGYSFFERYLRVFENVRLIAHVEENEQIDISRMLRVDGEGLEIFAVPFPHGKIDYIKKYLIIRKRLKDSLIGCSTCVLRIPDQLAFQVFHRAEREKIPVGVEVTSNSWEFFERGSIRSFMRPFLRWYWDYEQKRVCKKALGTSYVTKEAIQKRYQPSRAKGTFTTFCSSVDTTNCKGIQRHFSQPLSRIKCLHVSGSISGRAKGHYELISAAAIVKRLGIELDISLIGGDDLDPDIQQIVDDNKLNIMKLGPKTPSEVAKEMQKSDLFIFPSYREGLPRVVIEAMANGMVCIATDLDGIKELLNEDMRVPVKDFKALADKILYLSKHPAVMEEESKRNIKTAEEYAPENLRKRRDDFYRFLRNAVEDSHEV